MSYDLSIFLVAELEVQDPARMRDYADRVEPLVERFGGRIVARSMMNSTSIEGDWRPDVVVVQRWDSRAAFDAFWTSPEYEPLRELRRSSSRSRIVLVPVHPRQRVEASTI